MDRIDEHTYHLIVHVRESGQYPGNSERYELITTDLDTIQAELIIAREGPSPLSGDEPIVHEYLKRDQLRRSELDALAVVKARVQDHEQHD